MLANQGLGGEALRLMSRYLVQNPGDAKAARVASDIHLNMGNPDQAIETLTEAHRANPDDDDLTFRLAHVLSNSARSQDAIDLLAQLLERTPDALMPLRLYGELCFQTSQLQHALEAFTRISELKPRSAEGHLNRVKCLHTLLMPEEAKEAARAGLERCPRSIDLRLALAQVLYDQGSDEEALEVYDAALEQKEHPGALIGKGRCLHRIHGPAEAEAVAIQAIEIDPSNIEAHRLLAAVQRDQKNYDAAIETLTNALTTEVSGEIRGHATIELAQILDKAGRYDEAYTRVEDAHKHLTPTHIAKAYHWKNFVANLLAWREDPSCGDTRSWASRVGGTDTITPAFLIGFPRSGTTLVEQMIGSLDGWMTSDEKPMLAQLEGALARKIGVPVDELRASLGKLTDDDIVWARAWYAELCEFHLGPDATSKKILDKQPYNTPLLALIRRVFPEAKVLVALRDPRDVCLSVIMQDVTPNRGMRHYPTIDAVARVYHAMMGLYLIDRNRLGVGIHEFRYEDIVSETEPTLRKIVEFLGEQWDDSALEYTKRASERRSRINSESVKQQVYTGSIGRWKHYEHYIGDVFSMLEPYRAEFGYA